MERTITIRGPLDKISMAEERISGKLRQCWENDMMNQPHVVYGGGPHPLMAPNLQSGGGLMDNSYGGGAAPFQPLIGPPHGPPNGRMGAPQPLMGQHQLMTEVVHMWVPNSIVGALIGTKGVHIRNVMRLTGAHIRIEGGGARGPNRQQMEMALEEDGPMVDHPSRPTDERLVTITGTDAQQYKAQFWIYQRVCEQGYHFFDEVRLCTEVSVPTKLVGRIIGKGGQNVRELQRVTGAQVKIPEDAANADSEETIVRITGSFNASQAVQARIRQLVQQFHIQGGMPMRLNDRD